MKEQLKKINELNIDLDLFYVVTIYETKVQLQGHLKSETKKQIEELGFKFKLSESSNMIEATSNEIEFILTF